MQNVWALASIWVGLALIATLLAIWFRISTALSEIVVGTVAQLIIGALVGPMGLAAKTEWITFLAGTGAIVLTFLAGAELDPIIFRTKWKEATAVGLVGFFGPFLGCTAVAHYVLHWTIMSSWLAGVALSTTSVAVVYAVMLELGLNKTEFGKAILAACFVNDLGTVIALGLIFSPFTIRTVIFVVVSAVVFFILPFLTPRFFRHGWIGGVVGERGCSSRIHHWDGFGWNGRKRPRAHSPTSDTDFRTPHTVLLHTCRVICVCPCAGSGTTGVPGFVWGKDGVEDDRPLSHREIF